MGLSFASSWLNRYYAVKDAYDKGEDLATTATSCAAVLLASAVAESRSVQTLSALTGFPRAFIEATLLVADSVGHFCSSEQGDLLVAVHHHPDDLDRIEHMLDLAMSLIWEGMDRNWTYALNMLRARYVYGGKHQPWLHDWREFGPLYPDGR
jgi:hypothetical protein